jgi:hypothetical protein
MRRLFFVLLIIAAVLFAAGGLLLTTLGAGSLSLGGALGVVAAYTVFFVVGLLILRSQPGHRIGLLLVTGAMGMYFYGFVSSYALYSYRFAGASLPLTSLAVWFTAWAWAIYVWPIMVGLPLLFPNGQLPSPRWRPFLWAAVAFMGVICAYYAFAPGPVAMLEPVTNPFGVPALGRLPISPEDLENWYWPVPVLAILSLLLRFRHARGEERAQIKWFLYAAVFLLLWGIYGTLVSAGLLPVPGPRVSSTVFTLIVGAFGAAIAIAILKYRLYDIDIIIRRTLGYSLVTALLAVIFVGGVIVLQRAFAGITAQESQPAIVLSTLVIAALFNPLRLRIQGWIDRRFYRRKYDAQRVLARLTQVASDETDVDRLLTEIAAVVEEAVHPAQMSIWLAGAGRDDERAAPNALP